MEIDVSAHGVESAQQAGPRLLTATSVEGAEMDSPLKSLSLHHQRVAKL